MFMNLIVIVFVLGIAYAWSTRGVFNSMIHAMCVFFAGAIAFALWEPLAMLMLGLNDHPLIEGTAWGVSLIVPFILIMLLLRVGTDKLIKSNIKSVKAIDYGGGAAFGLISSVLTAGVLVTGIGYLRLPSTFLGYQPVWYVQGQNGAGSLVKNDKLWIPVDTLTAAVYKNLSGGSMSSAEPLKKWYPDLTLTGFATRINPGDGAARNAIGKDHFKPMSSYIIGNINGSTEKDDTLGEQKYQTIDGKNASSFAGYMTGYVVEFGPKAKEKGGKGGQVVVSNGQIHLLTQLQDGSTQTIFPLATISESSDQGKYGRWIFDSNDLFITSTGGKSRVPMGFEFYVPADQTPLALYVKNIRVPINDFGEPREFAKASDRDKLIRTGSLLNSNRIKRSFDLSEALIVDGKDSDAKFSDTTGTVFSLSLAKQRGLSINDNNKITEGRGTFDTELETGRKNAPQGKKLRVDKFWFGDGQTMVKVEIGSDAAGGLLSEAAKSASGDEPFILVDSNDNEYEAVGYVFSDEATNLLDVRYTPGNTLSGINEKNFPQISRSKENQKLALIFLVSKKVEIKYFTIGDTVLIHYQPGLTGR